MCASQPKKTRDTMIWWLGRFGTVSSNDHKRCITMCLFFSIMKLFRALHISHTMRSQSLTLTLHHLLQFRHPLCSHRQQGSNRSMRSQCVPKGSKDNGQQYHYMQRSLSKSMHVHLFLTPLRCDCCTNIIFLKLLGAAATAKFGIANLDMMSIPIAVRIATLKT